MSTLTLPAPAKLNLFLHILGRRDDGYHELQTVFQLLDYGDSLEFSRKQGDSLGFSCTDATLETADNLVLRAARLLLPHRRSDQGWHIHLRKRLPAGGGLGGGSSDAATALVALNRLWRCGLSDAQLLALGAGLGADIPVFLGGRSAWAQGTGEKLEPLALPERWYVVLTPACKAETVRIFGHPQLTRDSAAIRIPAFPFPGTRNDCQTVAISLYPQIGQALEWLGRFAEPRMTGTGASVFAAVDDEARAREILALFETLPHGWTGFSARGVNRSPLYDRLR